MHPAQLPSDELLEDCVLELTRGQGPGGQHRNKTSTAVVLRHVPSGVRGEASERRSQAANRRQALARLRIRLAVEVRRPRAAEPSERWVGRRRGARLTVSATHEDFAALLAEALDALAGAGWDLGQAAAHLGITPTQLARFVAREKQAWALLNAERSKRGLPGLR